MKNADERSCFVAFLNNVTGLVPKKFVADRFVSNAAEIFPVGTSVRACVVEMDEERARFVLSLKASETREGGDTFFLASHVEEMVCFTALSPS